MEAIWLSSRVKMEAEADGSAVLRVAVPEAEKDGQFFAVRKIDLKPFRGRPVILRAEVKAVEVSRPAQHWNGVKVMLHCKTPSVEFWRNPMGLCGTFDWQCVETRLTVPHDADEGEVSLGLQGSSGTLLIRNWELIAGELPYRLPENFKAEYTERVSGVPVLRGMMSPEQLRDGDLEELRSWGANLVRWQIIRNWLATGTDRDPEEYLGWFRSKLDELDRALELCRGLGLKLVIDLHAPPGGRHAGSDYEVALFHEPDYAEMFYELWEEIAKRYKGHPAVWGYDIMNEPVQARWPAAVDYQTLCYETARRIRAVDPEVPIIVESADWASPKGFAELQPLPFPNIVYQVHMYLPHKFTHQDVGAHRHSPPVSYPRRFRRRGIRPGAIEAGAAARAGVSGALRRADLRRGVLRRPLGARRGAVPRGCDFDLRGVRLGLELPRFSGIRRLECGDDRHPRESGPPGGGHRPQEGIVEIF